MPFTRYFVGDADQPSTSSAGAAPEPSFDGSAIQLEVPSFISAIPTLAPGGGAEVLTYNPAWWNKSDEVISNNGLPLPSVIPSPPPAPPLGLGLPVYSATGFDLLSILARVATRPNPSIALGPVDLTCSFVVVDVRRYDQPIVYCSPSFCRLTGYAESEIIGRNCRFLQAPGGAVLRGSSRRFTSQKSVSVLHKALSADKEVQTTIVNYRKDGTAFINLVSVIPILGGASGSPEEANDVVWHVGFQVDLTEQPDSILDRVRDGTYTLDKQHTSLWNRQLSLQFGAPRADSLDKRKHPPVIPPIRISASLIDLVQDEPTQDSSVLIPGSSSSQSVEPSMSHPVSHMLLSHAPDFIHVVSLKGEFLYVAPSVTHILEYLPSEMTGLFMADFAHPEDVVPLERQLKESSTFSSLHLDLDGGSDSRHGTSPYNGSKSTHLNAVPRPVDIVFRARTKSAKFVWLECRGRLHVEPGKGRKAVFLSGRARKLECVSWGNVQTMNPSIVTIKEVEEEEDCQQPSTGEVSRSNKAKGKRRPSEEESSSSETKNKTSSPTIKQIVLARQMEFWAMLGGLGRGAGAMISISAGVEDVIGWPKDVLVGRRITDLVIGGAAKAAVDTAFATWDEWERGGDDVSQSRADTEAVQILRCSLRAYGQSAVRIVLVLYRSSKQGGGGEGEEEDWSPTRDRRSEGAMPAHLLLQVRVDCDSRPNLSQVVPSINMSAPGWMLGPGSPPSSGFPMESSGQRHSDSEYSHSMSHAPPPSVTSIDPLLTRPAFENMFVEMETGRGSSWQYELQQLRFANQRLEEEIRRLEGGMKGVSAVDYDSNSLVDESREREEQQSTASGVANLELSRVSSGLSEIRPRGSVSAPFESCSSLPSSTVIGEGPTTHGATHLDYDACERLTTLRGRLPNSDYLLPVVNRERGESDSGGFNSAHDMNAGTYLPQNSSLLFAAEAYDQQSYRTESRMKQFAQPSQESSRHLGYMSTSTNHHHHHRLLEQLYAPVPCFAVQPMWSFSGGTAVVEQQQQQQPSKPSSDGQVYQELHALRRRQQLMDRWDPVEHRGVKRPFEML